MFTFGEVAWMFLVYGLVGWLWETPFVSIKNKKFVNRGFLRGPIIPIYGFAATTIMLSLAAWDPTKLVKGVQGAIIIMIYAALVATVWEYMTSYLLEVLFKTRWWDYSKRRFNLKGRIALRASVFWGIGSTMLWFFVNPKIIAFYGSVPESVMKAVLFGAYFIVLVDVGFTLVELINLRSLVIKLHQTSEEMVTVLTEKLEKLGEMHIISFLSDAKANLKTRVEYRKYEGFQAFSEFLDEMTNKGKDWALDNEILSGRFNEMLSKLKGNVRFFRNYPDAKTKHFQMVFITRKLDEAIHEFLKQINYKNSNGKK
ncbi:MAG TPA: hypothetical protein DCS67_02895 [Clostridiales bacterium UBA8960]|jgi:uncharacterized membrane protein|nr:hypothetical protein [Clostridiales bacterium UBA8960]